jgi:hypothetical protein
MYLFFLHCFYRIALLLPNSATRPERAVMNVTAEILLRRGIALRSGRAAYTSRTNMLQRRMARPETHA